MPFLTKNKKILLVSLSVFLILIAVFVLGAHQAQAIVGDYILSGVAWLAYGILWIFSRLVSLAAYLLESVFQIEKFTQVPIVVAGWQITRGLCNMIFALILLLMAFDTILQTNKFPIKTVLPRLIIVALLINFSLVFCGVIIDFSQILTRFFIDAAGGSTHSISTQLANGLNIAQVFKVPDKQLANEAQLSAQFGGGIGSLLTIFGSLVLGIIVVLIAAFALAAGAIFMLIRMVSLWILLITAPLAWMSMITPGLPGLDSMVGGWWKKFFQWTFFAPIYAFFIYLAVLAAAPGANSTSAIFQKVQTEAEKKITEGIFSSNFLSGGLFMVLQYLVIIMLLLAGLKTAQDSGLAGANKVLGWGKSLKKGAGALAGVGGKFLERWAAKGAEEKGTDAWSRTRRAVSYLAPTPWKEAWKKRSAQKEREAMPVAAGARQDLLNRVLPGWEKTDYRARATRQREVEERKDIISANAPELIAQFMLAEQKGNAPKMGAYTQTLANQNDLNELFKALKQRDPGTDYSMSAEGIMNLVDKVLAPKMGQGEANRLGHDLVRILEGKGQWLGRPFDYKFDPETKTGQYVKIEPGKRPDGTEMSVADTARSNATGEWSKMDAQPQIYNTGRFSYYKENYDDKGNVVKIELTDDGKRKLSTLNAEHANRWHAQTKLITMFKNPEELKHLNEELYKRVLTTMANSAKNMGTDDFENYINYNAESVPSVTKEDVARLTKLIDDERIIILKKEEGEKKKKEKEEEKEEEGEKKETWTDRQFK